MNLLKNTELLDTLSMHYAMGQMHGGAKRRFEQWLDESVTVRSAVQKWQDHLKGMNELQPAVQPSPNVWKRIEIALAQEKQAKLSYQTVGVSKEQLTQQSSKGLDLSGLQQRLNRWRAWGFAGMAGVLASVLGLWVMFNTQQSLTEQVSRLNGQLASVTNKSPPFDTPQYSLAMLVDEKSQPALLVKFDKDSQRLTLKRLSGYFENKNQSLQLWAISSAGSKTMPAGKPVSLGVINSLPPNSIEHLPVNKVVDSYDGLLLAVSIEPKGGVSGATGPTGPVIFKGPVIEAML
jgi:anti-sigma-K factor RskA